MSFPRFILGVFLSLVSCAAGAEPVDPVTIFSPYRWPTLQWSNELGQAYCIQTTEQLATPDWTTVATVTTDAPEAWWGDEYHPLQSTFYRVATATNPAPYQAMQQALEQARINQGIVGASAAAILPEHGLWLGTSGHSHDAIPIHPQTRFEIASVTKTFVAATALILQEEGVLDLDDTVGDWLPNLNHPHIADSITLRQLLNHRGGVYNFGDNGPFRTALFSDWARFWQPEEVLDYVNAPPFPPGTDGQYSNSGYVLMGMIIRAATASTMAAELRRTLLDPIDLPGTVMGGEEDWSGHLAHPHLDLNGDSIHEDLGAHSQTSILSAFWTSGAIVSTPADVARFANGIFAGGHLSPASLSEMQHVRAVDIGGSNFNYGLGLMRFDIFDREHWAHTGGLFGHYAWLSHCPETGVTLAISYNYPQTNGTGTSFPGGLLVAIEGLAEPAPAAAAMLPEAAAPPLYPFLFECRPDAP